MQAMEGTTANELLGTAEFSLKLAVLVGGGMI
jgi:hypothetical protein